MALVRKTRWTVADVPGFVTRASLDASPITPRRREKLADAGPDVAYSGTLAITDGDQAFGRVPPAARPPGLEQPLQLSSRRVRRIGDEQALEVPGWSSVASPSRTACISQVCSVGVIIVRPEIPQDGGHRCRASNSRDFTVFSSISSICRDLLIAAFRKVPKRQHHPVVDRHAEQCDLDPLGDFRFADLRLGVGAVQSGMSSPSSSASSRPLLALQVQRFVDGDPVDPAEKPVLRSYSSTFPRP